MTQSYLSDETIATMSADARRDLIQRLERPLSEVAPPYLARSRALRLGLMIGGSIALIPWITYLAFTLPENYVAQRWTATWVGFDMLVVTFMIATAALALLRRQLLVLTAFATGVLLICDAWFDVMTAGPAEVRWAILTAVAAELPVAVVMIRGALLVTRLTMTRLLVIDPGMPALAGTAAAVMVYQQCANPSQYCGKRSTGTSSGFTNCRLKGFFVIPG
ncbi:Uncharacterised protein [Mycobacteroides abscessus subsp. bolletii]|uniref:Uncharacterized protein n=1 Tax=Mycobacteroides abscessus subsp. bolletii TaxID=319705 RepID=A0A9Q7SDK2_9MYCO|nr:Uncharacterised protein [Mycobacteroides abscessus subsp. bolletii]SHV16466.1 Uncharacterised protein [Mycobacteroides abscessus subsp. bolletii]SHX24671.1 Uncharacterised protein [Mycobacteroides abscessus subsp. bolletii]SKM82285.1 Uncharacterised protein [Mycobacteroides abscessus subsp. bolletii]SKN51788.1 Uncharacterised protein [Mycobacteroides abscessus subsp. bolletii]